MMPYLYVLTEFSLAQMIPIISIADCFLGITAVFIKVAALRTDAGTDEITTQPTTFYNGEEYFRFGCRSFLSVLFLLFGV